MIYRFEVVCYSRGKIVRTIAFWTLKDAENWVYVNKNNYDKVVIRNRFIS